MGWIDEIYGYWDEASGIRGDGSLLVARTARRRRVVRGCLSG